MGRYRGLIAVGLVGAAVLAGCASGGTQQLSVLMTEGAWSVDPAEFEDVTRLEFTFSNHGAEPHQPIVVNMPLTVQDLEKNLRENGTAPLVGGLLSANPPIPDADVVYPGAESGAGRGHFHPGDPDEPQLPAHALVEIHDEGQTIAYLLTDLVAPDTDGRGSATAGKVSWGNRGASTTFVVLCIDPEHAERDEYAVFSILVSEADGGRPGPRVAGTP